jgi:hypothetical protein
MGDEFAVHNPVLCEPVCCAIATMGFCKAELGDWFDNGTISKRESGRKFGKKKREPKPSL